MSIKCRLGTLVVLLVSLTAAAVAATYTITRHQDLDAAVINMAGRQRMLTQQIARLALSILAVDAVREPVTEPRPNQSFQQLLGDRGSTLSELRSRLHATIDMFERQLVLIRDGGELWLAPDQSLRLKKASRAARRQVEVIDKAWQKSKRLIEGVYHHEGAAGEAPLLELAQQLDRQSLNLLAETDWLVQILTEESRAEVLFVHWLQLLFLVLALLAAVVAWRFSRRSISAPLERLAATVGAIERGDLAARTDFVSRDEIGALSRGINNMSKSLEQERMEQQRLNDSLQQALAAREQTNLVLEENNRQLEEKQVIIEQEREELSRVLEQLTQTQAQLLQSEKMAALGQLVAGIAHEINNPLGYLSSNIGSLQSYCKALFDLMDAHVEAEAAIPDEKLRERLRTLRQDAELDFLREDLKNLIGESQEGLGRVKKIVQDLKDFAHVGRKEFAWADLHLGIDSTLNIVHNELKYKATVVREYGELPEVECVISQLNQVFMNLLVNAAHAIEDKGTIRIRTGVEGSDWVWVRISDSGKGIPPEHLKKIFDPFFTTKPVGKGTGLGLSVSFGVVEQHGGRIEVESEPGKGTAFTVWLPRAQPLEAMEAALD